MKKILLFSLLSVLVVFPFLTLAQSTGCPTGGLVPCGGLDCPCTFCKLFDMFANVVNFILFSLVPAIAILMIAIGGFMMVVSIAGGSITSADGAKGGAALIAQAKKLFVSVGIGLLIVYGAWLFIAFLLTFPGLVSNNIVQSPTSPASWFTINCTDTSSTSGGGPAPAPAAAPVAAAPAPAPYQVAVPGTASSIPIPATQSSDLSNFTALNRSTMASGEGQEFDFTAQNNNKVAENYTVLLRDSNDNIVDSKTFSIEPGQTTTNVVYSPYNASMSGGHIQLSSGVDSYDSTKVITSVRIP